HNPEFTILEWYRPGYDALALIHEVGQLCTRLLDIAQPPIVSYAEAFESTIGLDPMRCADETLFACCRRHGLQGDCAHRDEALDFLMSGVVMQQLSTRTCFIFGYPPSQAALAEIEHGLGTEDETVAFGDARIRPPFARRFELYIEGVEIANGYQELRSAAEQRARILADLAFRRDAGLPELPVDEHLLAALAHGLPSVSGVAMGLDRLLMLAMDARTIDAVLAFPVARA
ncbi:MAG: hypothetical protein KDK91_21595, partial [Gammaproteobacteria bacterium]|nr:hypothetical protein [Gammaproteobacteria bacterium]